VDVPAEVDGHAQQPVDGASLLGTFDDADAPAPRRMQYFELLGSRAMYLDGWKATTDHVGRQLTVEREALVGSQSFETDRWLLFNLEDDFSEAHDVADEHPEVVRRLEQHWWAEAGRNGVLPLEDSFLDRVSAMSPDPYPSGYRTTYRPGGGGIIEDALPPMGGGFVLTADLHVADGAGAPEGIVCALGDWNNGWAWYLLDGRPVAAFNLFSHLTQVAAGDDLAPLGPGDHELGLEYERQGDQRTIRLRVDHEVVAEGELPEDLPFRWQVGGGGLLIGRDTGFPVSDDYEPPFPMTADLRSVTFEIPMLAPKQPSPAEQRARAIKHE
jgi:arylsulfatase